MALGHYQFEALHPFSDGNGRVGRLVAILQLTTDNTLRLPALNLSPWLESHRDQYIDSLFRVSKTGDFDNWIIFFSRAVQIQAYDGIATIAELLAYKDATIVELRSSRARGIILQIVENLIGYPILDIPTVRKLTGKTFEAANQAVARLVDHGILREITGRRINRLFISDPVLKIISRAVPIKSDEMNSDVQSRP